MNTFEQLLEEIGEPAAVELLAEECTELAHAALKYSRILRAENPTPVTAQKALNEVLEEIADVQLCLSALKPAGWLNLDMVDRIFNLKLERWQNRMVEHGKSRYHIDNIDT